MRRADILGLNLLPRPPLRIDLRLQAKEREVHAELGRRHEALEHPDAQQVERIHPDDA